MGKAILAIILTAVGAIGAAMALILHDLPISQVFEARIEPTIVLEAADGTELARKGPLRGPPAARKDIPQHLIDAVIAIEDRRFYSHSGVDPLGIVRAFSRNLVAGEVVEGGSTITQQLVKLRLGDGERTIRRKIREAVLALWLERRLSKGEILTHYLNGVYFGAGAIGISAAAQIYFNKSVAELSVEESALLAGLITAPSRLNPHRNPEAAYSRAAVVLDAMVANRRLDGLRAEAAKKEPAALQPSRTRSAPATWFTDWVHGEAKEIIRSFDASRVGAVRVRTTLNLELQSIAERVVAGMLEMQGEADGATQAALVAMRPDGAVLAMVGGRSYEKSEFNRAVQAMRQPGSAFKLFVYFAALRHGYALDDVIEDAPLDINGWKPKNFGERYYGRVRLADAFTRSLNTAAVRLAQTVGVDQVVEAARLLGIDAPLSETPSLALGASEVSLLDLTGAYASVAAGRAPIEPWGIAGFGKLDQHRLLAPGPPATPPQSLGGYQRQLVELLRGVVDHGTGRAAALDGFAAGKTGTSENHRDAWFIGFTEDLVVGVWVGNDDGGPMSEVTGGKLPALIWKQFVSAASPGRERPPPATDGTGDHLVGYDLQLPDAERGLAAPRPQCDVAACSRAYRSFRPSDCTYQPYHGPRRLCQRGNPKAGELASLGREPEDIEEWVTDDEMEAEDSDDAAGAVIIGGLDHASEVEVDEQTFGGDGTAGDAVRDDREDDQQEWPDDGPVPAAQDQNEPTTGARVRCDVDACSRAYGSFRASDCTYQPYRGPRLFCPLGFALTTAPDGADEEIEPELLLPESGSEAVAGNSSPAASRALAQCNYDACSRAYRSFRASDCTYQPYRGPRRICRK